MIDAQTVQTELTIARTARMDAETACCDVEEFADEIRRAHLAFMLARFGVMPQRVFRTNDERSSGRILSSVPLAFA